MITTPQPLTLAEYATFSDNTDRRYELVNGHLTPMPTESDLNDRIASFLYAYLLQRGIPWDHLSMKVQIAVSGKLASARQPDLTLLSEDAVMALKGAKHRLITHEMPPPALVVEVVSPQQQDRDYRHKRTEYAGRQIPEYWIVDPIVQRVTLLTWVNGLYEEHIYVGPQPIQSPTLPNLTLTAAQVLFLDPEG